MKKGKLLLFVIYVFFIFYGISNAAIVGDIDDNGRIDLSEAVYALQVSAGVYPSLDPSCMLAGKGDWATGKNYNKCDVVKYNSVFYAASATHLSSSANLPTNTNFWTQLTLKGEKGDQGPIGPQGPQGPAGPTAICTWDGTTYSTGAYCVSGSSCPRPGTSQIVTCQADGSWVQSSLSIGSTGTCPQFCGY